MENDNQSGLNADVWSGEGFVKDYAGEDLKPVESILFAGNRKELEGRVLELGCGAGRVTGHLIEIAQTVHGLDISPAMVAYCRGTYPQAAFSEGDLRDLSAFPDGSYDAVVAIANVLDVLGDADRRRVLGEIARILTPGGLFIASSHNLAFAPRIAKPTRIYARNPRRIVENVVRLPRRLRNRRRLAPLQRVEFDYAILIDEAHDFTLLHYYISRDAQARQFIEQGFELLECLDLKGATVGPGETSARSSELHYVARRTT
jgi:SAM-dependent methyltransferase